MELKELVSGCREDLDDVAPPHLFSKPRLVRYANEAESEACRRARLITDSSTAEICTAAVAIDRNLITLDPRVIFVRAAKLASKTVSLDKIRRDEMDECNPGWLTRTGDVVGWIPDFQSGKLRLYRTPIAADSLELTVVRTPLAAMLDDKDTPEIAPRFHEKLIHWMLYRCYLKHDVETFDEKAAARHLAFFEAEFGKASSAIDETFIHERHGYQENEGLY